MVFKIRGGGLKPLPLQGGPCMITFLISNVEKVGKHSLLFFHRRNSKSIEKLGALVQDS